MRIIARRRRHRIHFSGDCPDVDIPFAFGVAPGADRLLALINEWVLFAENEGMVEDAYEYWVLGQGAEDTTPRWSVIRNVLGWIE